MKRQLYIDLVDIVDVYAIYRCQGGLQVLQLLIDRYENARNELAALEADIGAED